MLAEMLSDPYSQLLVVALIILFGGGGLGLYADHMRRKYEALEDAHREAERGAQYGVTLPIPDIPHQLG
jgi:hypothetical protein